MSDTPDAIQLSDWFWEMIDTSEHQLQRLAEKLEVLPKEQLLKFHVEYNDAKGEVNPFDNEALGAHLSGSCGEDSHEDFADWVVSQGRYFFQQVIENPADIDSYIETFWDCEGDDQSEFYWNTDVEREEYRGYQSPGYIARG